MPPKRSLKYLPKQCSRSLKRRSIRRDPPNKPSQDVSSPLPVGIIVNWLSVEPLSYSDRQWLLLTSAVCTGDTVRYDDLPGKVTFESPNLNIEVDSIQRFVEFQRRAVLLPKNPKYSVCLIHNTPNFTACCINHA